MIKFMATADAPKDVVLPRRSTKCSAGYDFYAPCDIYLRHNGCSGLIKLNVKVILPQDMYLELHERSSLAVKQDVVLECGGIIDSDYANNPDNDGCICVKLRNNGDMDVFLAKGSRICQGIIKRYYVTDDDKAEMQRSGGFGSTGE